MLNAACIGEDPEMWFPGPGILPAKAIEICTECPVRLECLKDALLNEITVKGNRPYGVFGGMTAKERARVKTWELRAIYGDVSWL